MKPSIYTTFMDHNNFIYYFFVAWISLLFLTIAPTSGHKCICLEYPRGCGIALSLLQLEVCLVLVLVHIFEVV